MWKNTNTRRVIICTKAHHCKPFGKLIDGKLGMGGGKTFFEYNPPENFQRPARCHRGCLLNDPLPYAFNIIMWLIIYVIICFS